jgi:hypothetical protein
MHCFSKATSTKGCGGRGEKREEEKGYQEEERKTMGSLIHMHPGGSTDLAPF